jgi:flagellar basal body rod protein FlgG
MFQALYRSASALDALNKQHELIASNLAHLGTPGYRRKIFTTAELTQPNGIQTESKSGRVVNSETTDFAPAGVVATGKELDIALNGDGFFSFQGPDGELLSRNGVLMRRADGTLVNLDNMPILTDQGPITVDPQVAMADVHIGADGTVTVQSSVVGKIKMTSFEKNSTLQSKGQVYFEAGIDSQPKPSSATVLQGYRENSNAHPVTELIGLIMGSRHFEAAQRTIQAISETMKDNLRD